MTAIHGADDRNLIPRWREFGDAVRSGELDSTAPHKESLTAQRSDDSTELREAADAFTHTPGIHAAGDLLTQALLRHAPDHKVARSAADFVLESPASRSLHELARLYLGTRRGSDDGSDSSPVGSDRAYVAARTAQLRAILRREPRNAIRWTDLALAQVKLGSLTRAERSMRAALGLQPANRFVLRSAVRLFVHVEKADAAHALLERAPRTLEDPWLRAAWLASANVTGARIPSLRGSRRMLEAARFAPWHLSELAGQIATLELESGDVRRARRTMRLALIDPTENTLAQAEWAAKRGIEAPSPDELGAPLTFEARARAFASMGDFKRAVEAGLQWQTDQAFDPSPAVFLSYLASIAVEDYNLAERAARQGLVSNHSYEFLRNNLVFALANQGKVLEAKAELDRINRPSPGTREAHTLMATRGLVSFRSGEPEAGRALYGQAIELLMSGGEDDIATLAQIFWAREEIMARTPNALALATRAMAMANRSRVLEVELWRDRLFALAQQADLPRLAARASEHPAYLKERPRRIGD